MYLHVRSPFLILIRHCFCFGFGFGLGLVLLDSHPVLYTLHAVYVVGEFGGQVLFGCVFRLATQCNN